MPPCGVVRAATQPRTITSIKGRPGVLNTGRVHSRSKRLRLSVRWQHPCLAVYSFVTAARTGMQTDTLSAVRLQPQRARTRGPRCAPRDIRRMVRRIQVAAHSNTRHREEQLIVRESIRRMAFLRSTGEYRYQYRQGLFLAPLTPDERAGVALIGEHRVDGVLQPAPAVAPGDASSLRAPTMSSTPSPSRAVSKLRRTTASAGGSSSSSGRSLAPALMRTFR